MIYIEKDTETVLPKKYHVAHNFCVQVYDMILEILEHETFKDLFNSEFSFKKGENFIKVKEFENNDIHPFDWLVKNNKLDILEKVLCKRLLTSITGDLLNFLYEGLNCSMRGKTSVAYANFRKPLKDSLTLLEMILVDPAEFTRKYYLEGNPQNYDPSSRKLNKEEIIEKALEKLGKKNGLLNKEIIHTLRFEKSNVNSFDSLSNLALHIVTRDKNYRTEDKNLNFIFSTKEDIDKQWEHIYFFIPYLMVYIFSVIDEISFSLIDINKGIKKYRNLTVMLKLMYCMSEHDKFKNADELILKLGKNGKCENCKEALDLGIHDLKLYFETDMLLCKNCLNNLIPFPEGYESGFISMEFKEEDFRG